MNEKITTVFLSALKDGEKGLMIGFLFGVLISGTVLFFVFDYINGHKLEAYKVKDTVAKERIANLEKTIIEIKEGNTNKLNDYKDLYNLKISELVNDLKLLSNNNSLLSKTNQRLLKQNSQLSNEHNVKKDKERLARELSNKSRFLRESVSAVEHKINKANTLASKHKQACEEYKQGKNWHFSSRSDCEQFELAISTKAELIIKLNDYKNEINSINTHQLK